MSDIFERLQPTNLFTVDREGTQQRRAENNDFWDRQNQEQQEVNQQRQKNLDRYTVHLSDDQYEILNLAIANAEVPEDEAYNMAAALKLAEKYDLPLADARRNLERYRDAIFGTGKRYTPKDSFTAIADNWQIGVNTMSLGKLGNELSVAHEEGDAERAAALWEKIQQLKQETDSLADYQDRNVVIEALKFGAQSVPFTGAVAGTAIVGNLLAPGVGSIAAFSTSVALTRGQEYIDLLEAGANPEIARRVATASGVIQAGVEMALGNVASAAGGAVKLLGKKAIGPGSPAQALAEKLTADILKKLHWSGTFRRAAIRLGTGYAFEALEEGTEEVIQELVSVASLQAAASLQGEGVTTKTAREVGEAVGESFRGGLMGSLVLGIPGTIFNTGATVRDARKVMAAAETTPSREAFKKDTAGSRLFEGMSDERREAAQDELYNKAQQRRDREEARLTEEIKARGSQLEGLQERKLNKEGEDVTPGVYRNRDGSLYTRIEDEKRENGVITGSFRMGDASRTTESNTYGAIDYRIDGGALTITGFHVADHRRDLTDEFYQQFAKKFADNTIQWDPESEADIALKEHLATQNRRGPEAALNYFEPESVRGEALEIQQLKQNVDRQLAQALPRSTPESRQGVVSLLDRIGRGYGLDFDAFLDRLGFDRENIFTNTPNQEVTEFNERAAQYAKDPDRAKARGALFKTLKQLDSDVKAVEYTVVYLDPEAADFSTVVHELKHAVDNFLEQADPELYRRMMDAAGAYDAKSGMDETTWRKERSAYAWENYLQTGQAPTPELRNLFRQMVEWLKDIVGNLSGMRKLTPEQKAAFDELLSKADAFEQEESGSPGNAAEINKDSPHNLVDVVDGGQDTASTPEGPQEASLTPPEGVSEGAGREDPEQRKRENQQILKDPAAGPAAKVAAALDDAGIAKAEVEGALFQTREDRIAALESSPDIVLDGNAYQGKYELNKESILDYLNNTLKKVTMYNPAIKEKIRLGGTGIDKLIGWGMNNEVYKKLFAHIPEITEKSIFIADEKPNRPKSHYYKYSHLVSGIKIDEKPYTVHIILGESGGTWYYSHILLDIDKGSLLAGIRQSTPGHPITSLSDIKDTTLLRLLQAPEVSQQKKSVTGNAGTYDPENPSILFQTYEELLEDAARYETAEAFEAAYRNPDTRPEDAYISTEADHVWYKIFWEDARTAAGAREEQTSSIPEQGDRAFLKDINREKLRDVLIELDNKLHDRQTEPVAPEEGEDRTAYDQEMTEYRKAQDFAARINRELPHRMAWVGIAARVANGEVLSVKDYNTLRGYLRDTPRDYRALFADLMDRREWGLNLTEMKDGLPDTPLSAPQLEQPDDMAQENRERLAAVIDEADPELARGIREGTIAYDDPRIRAFEQGLEAGIKKANEEIAAVEAQIAEDARKITDSEKNKALKLYQNFKRMEDRYNIRLAEIEEKTEQGKILTKRYQEVTAERLTELKNAQARFEEYVASPELKAALREELSRIDAWYEGRRHQRTLQRMRNAAREVRRIEESLIKRIVRKVSLKTVDYDQTVAITIVQSFFEPSLIAGVNHRLGTIRGPAIRELYEKWRTDADFREELRRQAGDRATKIADVLGKPKWEFITNQEKRNLIKMLPKRNWIQELRLEDLEAYREGLVPLDIKISSDGKAVLGMAEEQIARKALGDELYSRIQYKPLEAWTMLELAELAEVVDDLYVEGRETFRAKKEARYTQYENYRNKLKDILRITKYQIDPGDSPEEQKRKRDAIAKILGKYAAGDPGAEAAKLARRSWLERTFGGAYLDANVRRVARILDNGKDGTFTNLLYWQENHAFNMRERAKMARRLAVEDSMRKLEIKMPELFQKVTVKDLWINNKDKQNPDQVYTVEELLGMKLATRDELSRRAVIYGNLATETERDDARIGKDVAFLEQLANTAEGRFAKVMAAADAFFSQAGNDKYLKFMEAIARDYDGVYDRLNQTNITAFNEPVWKVEHYFPMFRLEQTGGVNEHQEVKDLLGIAGAKTQWADRGMTQTRIPMGPAHQTGIELGLYTTWAKSLDRTEHFIAYAPYVQTLNMVFRSRDGKALMQQLQDRYGAGMGDYIKEYINEKANPTAESNRHKSDNFVKAMRGRTASAYLAWKLSGVLKQMVTSPWPYLQYMSPVEYGAACITFYQNPKAMTEFIKGKSVFMATRTFDPLIKIIREQQALNRNKTLGKLDQFNNLGMKGLEMVDWACVAPGWMAVYNREMARLQKANAALAADQQLSMADMEYEAVDKADDIVRLTQPSGRDTDQSPLYKNAPQVIKALLQFTQSLNVIWQNIRYDMPAAAREGQFLQVVGGITGYILAGVSLGLLTEGLGGDDDDKKDDVAWQRQLLYYSFTQFTDAVPFIGDAVTTVWEGAATGRVRWNGGDNIFPVAKEFLGTAESAIKTGYKLSEGDSEAAKKAAIKALEHFQAGFFYSLGLPQSGGKELLRAFELDPLKGDLDPGFNPEAFLGRR